MNPKVAIVILVVIVVVFIVFLASGARSQTNTPHAGWLDAIQGKIHPQPLNLGDVSTSQGGCISASSLSIQVGSTCTYHVKSSSETSRRLKLAGGSAQVVLTNGDTALPGQKMNPDDTVDVFGAGGTLKVTCLGPFPCALVPSS